MAARTTGLAMGVRMIVIVRVLVFVVTEERSDLHTIRKAKG